MKLKLKTNKKWSSDTWRSTRRYWDKCTWV